MTQPLHRLCRIRSGDFRIGYRVNEVTKTVEVGVVCYRSQVYHIAPQRHLV